MPKLVILIGLPGSGKSRVATHLLEMGLGQGFVHGYVSTDRIRAQLFGDEAVQGSWGQIWQEIRRQFEQRAQLTLRVELELTIYDATNVVRRHRRDVISLARASGFTSVVGLWIDESVEVCLQRNQGRSRQVPEMVILKMQRHLQGAPPSLAEGFDELFRYASSAEALLGAASALT